MVRISAVLCILALAACSEQPQSTEGVTDSMLATIVGKAMEDTVVAHKTAAPDLAKVGTCKKE